MESLITGTCLHVIIHKPPGSECNFFPSYNCHLSIFEWKDATGLPIQFLFNALTDESDYIQLLKNLSKSRQNDGDQEKEEALLGS